MRLYAFIAVLIVVLGSAFGLLTRSSGRDAPAPQYRVTARAYDRLQPGVTSASQLPELGFDLPRGARLSYLAMVEQFMPDNSSSFDALDSSVQDCLQTRKRCTGYAFSLAGQSGVRAILVIQSGRLIYKSLASEVRTSTASRSPASSRD